MKVRVCAWLQATGVAACLLLIAVLLGAVLLGPTLFSSISRSNAVGITTIQSATATGNAIVRENSIALENVLISIIYSGLTHRQLSFSWKLNPFSGNQFAEGAAVVIIYHTLQSNDVNGHPFKVEIYSCVSSWGLSFQHAFITVGCYGFHVC